MTVSDVLLLCSVSVFLTALCVTRSRHHLLWWDETYGFTLLRSPSFARMLAAWQAGADGGGLFYYIFGRVWMQLFGFTPLSLRLFSTAGICGSLSLLWYSARRYYSTSAIACGVGLAYLSSAALLWQAINGRFYGFFLASAALAVLMFLLASEKRQITGAVYVLTGLAHALLVGSHILGIVYSAALIAGLVAFDLWSQPLRPRLYLSALTGWLVLAVSYRAIVNSASIATTAFWTVRPTSKALMVAILGDSEKTSDVGLVLAAAAVLVTAYRRQHLRGADRPSRAPVYALLASLYLAAFLLFLKSRHGISIFADRYLLPENLGFVLLAAESTTLIALSLRHTIAPAYLATVAVIVAFAALAYHAWRMPLYAHIYATPGYLARFERLLPPGEPVVATHLVTFAFFSTYDPAHRYIALDDVDYDRRSKQATTDTSMQRLLENWKRGGVDSDAIQSWAKIVANNPEFLVALSPDREAWMRDRILTDPDFQVRELGVSTEWIPVTLYDVRRVPPH